VIINPNILDLGELSERDKDVMERTARETLWRVAATVANTGAPLDLVVHAVCADPEFRERYAQDTLVKLTPEQGQAIFAHDNHNEGDFSLLGKGGQA
jgi:hypothetical protein